MLDIISILCFNNNFTVSILDPLSLFLQEIINKFNPLLSFIFGLASYFSNKFIILKL